MRTIFIDNILKKTFFLLCLFFLISCTDCKPVSIPYEDTEQYTTVEKRDVKLTYDIIDNCMYHRRESGTLLFGENPRYIVFCTVKNTSKYGGNFGFNVEISSQGDKLYFEGKEYISPGEKAEIRVNKEINPFTFQANVEIDKWSIKAPTVTVDEEVTRTRNVTKYRICYPCEEDCGKYTKTTFPTWLVFVLLLIIGNVVYIFIKSNHT